MMRIKAGRIACLGLLLSAQASLLCGCSLFFCGIPVGGRQEMAFVCERALAAEGQDEEASSAQGTGTKSAPEEEADDAGQEALTAGKVDLNSASQEELMSLNGIGETRARAILEYREQNGPFARKEDIMQVPGIKEGIYSKLQEQIVVR